MAYCTLEELKFELLEDGETETDDDELLQQKIDAAQSFIEAYTRRVWQVADDAEAVAHIFSIDDTDGRLLLLDDDLVEIETVTVNADGDTPQEVPNTDYTTLPRNKTPYYGIRIKDNSPYYWRYTADASSAISIDGHWAYALTPPADIKQACIRLAGFLYRIKDTNVYDVTASLETGQMIIPKGTPQDVINILNNRRKPTL